MTINRVRYIAGSPESILAVDITLFESHLYILNLRQNTGAVSSSKFRSDTIKMDTNLNQSTFTCGAYQPIDIVSITNIAHVYD